MSGFIYNITEFVNLKDKYLINGYIRLLIEDNPLKLIPQTVIIHCLWYYFQFELYFRQHDVYALDTSYDIYRYHCDKIPESFEDMNLREHLLRGIYTYGFEKPLPIQQRSILPIIKGRNIIVQSQSGSSKSSAYIIAILQILDLNEPQCQSLIIEPTRESARQHENMISKLSNYLNIRSRVCIGGMSVRDDVKAFSNNNIQIVIGTLGRINSMVSRGVLKLEKLKIIVFDDMDEMYIRAFDIKEQIYELIEYSPLNIQIAVFSCRICPEILQFEEKLMKNTHKIYLKKQEKTLDGIKQYYVDVENEELKLERIYELLKYMTDIDKLIIYCNTNKKVIWLTKQLEKYKFNVNGT
eukprot:193670_1